MLCHEIIAPIILVVTSSQISLGDQDRETIALAGCYELQAEGQHTDISNYGEFPRRLQLTLEALQDKGGSRRQEAGFGRVEKRPGTGELCATTAH